MPQLIISVEGATLTEADKARLGSPLVAGLILFTKNYETPKQLKALTDSIKAISSDLFIWVDQEGGRVQRFQAGFTQLPPLQSWEAAYADNPEQAITDLQASAKTMWSELKPYGIDMSLVPCLDLDWGHNQVIGDRSFSADPEMVCTLAKPYIEALQQAGMTVTGKHFPGHGYVDLDSHLDMPVDNRSWDEIKKTDAVPFLRLASMLDCIMPAHIAFPAVDELPVTFSKRWLQDILRAEIGYQGVIMSDCLSMVGAARLYDNIVDRVNAANVAGCDLTLLCNSDDVVDELLSLSDQLIPSSKESLERLAKLRQ